MAILFVKRERSERVPLGTQLRMDGHWSTQGLIAVWALNEGAGRPMENISGRFPTASVGSPAWGRSGLAFDGDDDAFSYAAAAKLNALSKWTLLVCSTLRGLSAVDSPYQRQISKPDAATARWLAGYDTAVGRYRGVIQGSTAMVASVAADMAGDLGKKVTWCWISDGSLTAANHRIYKNGVQQSQVGSVNGSGSPIADGLSVSIGGITTGSRSCNEIIHHIYLWDRQLSAVEIGAITANPYQIFQPLLVPVFVGAGGTAISLTHDLRAAIATAQTGVADSRIAVSGSLLLGADCLAAVATTVAATQDTRAAIANQTAQVHDTRLTVAAALTTLCDTLLNVSAQVGYAVNHDTRLTIATARSLAQDLRATVATQATTTHDTRQAVATAVTAMADTLADIAVQIGYTVQQDTRLVVSRKFSSAADTLAEIATEIRTSQDTRLIIGLIQRAAGVVFHLAAETRIFKMPEESRVLTLPPERRVFVLPREGKA